MKELSYLDFSQKAHEKSLSQGAFIKAQYEITYACNLHCVHCYTDPYNQRDLIRRELPLEEAFRVLDKLHTENIVWLCFTGGEIFMRKDFLEIYNYAAAKGFLITLFTNATLITDRIADHLAEKPPFSIEISIYGATPETYEAVTQVPGSFIRFEQGVRRLAKRNLPLKFKTSLLNINAHEAEGMRRFAEHYQSSIKMNPIIYPKLNGDTSSCQYRLSSAEVLHLIVADQEQEGGCAQKKDANEVIMSKPSPRLYRCGCGKLNAHVDPYGQVGTCTWERDHRFDYRQPGFQEEMQNLAGMIGSKYYKEDSQCFSCKAADFCSKNPEMAVHESGDAQRPVEHFCEIAFGLAEKLTQTDHNGNGRI